ncbi:MAG: right-handed parallel beta-helix repeat-containing protein [Phycisphaerae bacterium]|jgi:hypothetical protein
MSRAFVVALSFTLGLRAALAQPCSYGGWVGPGNYLLTAQYYSPTGPSSCAASRDAWLRYMPQTSGTLSVTPTNFDNSGMLALYASCPQGPGEELFCIPTPPGASSGFSLTVQPLVTYYLRIGMADFGDYAFTIAGPPAARVVGLDGAAGQYSSIPEAVNAAQDGDTIVVLPGEYPGDLIIDGRSLRIIGAGASQTVAALSFVDVYASSLRLERLTFSSPNPIFAGGSHVTARACVFDGGVGAGGGQVTTGSTADFYNCVIRNYDFGVYTYSATAVTLTNCTLVANGAAVYDNDNLGPPVQLTNCVVRNNSLAFDGPDASSTVATYSNIQGGWPGEGNIDADAQFVDPDGADNIPGNLDDDYRLASNSPCIDAGDIYAPAGAFDVAGVPRVVDHPSHSNTGGWPAAIDMGAYEAQPPVCVGDLDGDGSVGIADLSILLTVYGTMCP